jgi:hypothetical protein
MKIASFVLSALLTSTPSSLSPSHFSSTSILFASATSTASSASQMDSEYPGTAVPRMDAIRERVRSLNFDSSQAWEQQRKMILQAGGLKDLQSAVPGQGYTGHSFNDFNHVDLTPMMLEVSHSENEGRVEGIHRRNPLGDGIKIASLGEEDGLPAGGSWSTCALGCNSDPPQDVAHIQFRSRIAFKLVWCPPAFTSFVLVDDDGKLLNKGTPMADSGLPSILERKKNFQIVQGSKYAKAAEGTSPDSG